LACGLDRPPRRPPEIGARSLAATAPGTCSQSSLPIFSDETMSGRSRRVATDKQGQFKGGGYLVEPLFLDVVPTSGEPHCLPPLGRLRVTRARDLWTYYLASSSSLFTIYVLTETATSVSRPHDRDRQQPNPTLSRGQGRAASSDPGSESRSCSSSPDHASPRVIDPQFPRLTASRGQLSLNRLEKPPLDGPSHQRTCFGSARWPGVAVYTQPDAEARTADVLPGGSGTYWSHNVMGAS